MSQSPVNSVYFSYQRQFPANLQILHLRAIFISNSSLFPLYFLVQNKGLFGATAMEQDGDRHTNVAHRPNSPSNDGGVGVVDDLNANLHLKKDSLDVDGSVNSSNAQSSPPRPPTPTSATGVGGGGGGYDPNRIPSGVFTSKSGKGIDWSTTSNESLFSIYMGNNNSFSKEQIAMMNKSGELPILTDEELSSNVPPAPATPTRQPPLPPSPVASVRRNIPNPPLNDTVNNNNNNNNVVAVRPPPSEPAATGLNRNSTASSSTTTNRNSTSSTNSFQFPVLQQEQSGRTSTRIVEAEQNKLPEKKEEVVEEQTTTATEDDKNKVTEKEEEEQKQEQEQEREHPEQMTEDNKKTTDEEKTKEGGRSSNWLSCFPCFSK
ncbi:hypothetical protein LINGRAHAP2_LOCUS6927 [Linum grandiflorum]